MSKQNEKTLPSHRVYSVTKNGEKTTWTEIGAAWPNKDGNGFNLTFTALALPGAQIVLRVPKAKDEKAKTSRKADRYAELHATHKEVARSAS